MKLTDLLAYCDERLNAADFDDYCPNGLQVEASEEVSHIVSGVTASLAQIEAAAENGADLLLVHHGYFWKGEAAPLVGIKGRRVRHLMRSGLNLMAYHLPLDAHRELGNNAGLGRALGLSGAPISDKSLIWGAELPLESTAAELTDLITERLQRTPVVLDSGRAVRRVAWCTGAAQNYIVQAAEAGYDTFVSGEISEQTQHLADELGVSFFSAGHHATERFGVQSLGAELAERFALSHRYIDIDNPA